MLTNSLVANDVAAVHGGYSRYRKPLLEGRRQALGAEADAAATGNSSLFGSSGASLHTKAFCRGRREAVRRQLQPRPALDLAQMRAGRDRARRRARTQARALFLAQSAAARAWSVTLERGELRWHDEARVHGSPPMASLGRRFQAWLAGILPISSQL